MPDRCDTLTTRARRCKRTGTRWRLTASGRVAWVCADHDYSHITLYYHKKMSVDTGLEAIEAICDGEIDEAIAWARNHDVEIPDPPHDMEMVLQYEHDARTAYPKRMTFIQNIISHLRGTDPAAGVVSGRLEALAETFRRRADSAQEGGRHKEMDIWIDAETDTKRLIPDE